MTAPYRRKIVSQRPDLVGENPKELLKLHKIQPSEYESLLNTLGRSPTLAELGVISAMWSEHCSYKSSKIHLKRLPTTGEHVVQGPGENAGIVRFEDKLCVAFKMESHNHPSYIDPFNGAATGVGGILRDVFCVGARPIATQNCLRFGDKDTKKSRWLQKNVVHGIAHYGNCFGVANAGGNIDFDSSYEGNCLVNAMAVGLVDEDKIFLGTASGVGNLVVYLGAATGRDGIQGAVMASDTFTGEEKERGAIQVGDPFYGKRLLETTLKLLEKRLVVGLQDMGAAGLTSSSIEMASRAGNGVYINLDLLPVRAKNMTAYEMMLSESQERMLLVIEEELWPKAKVILEDAELPFAIIGEVTDTRRIEVVHQGQREVDLLVDPIAENAPQYDRPQRAPVSMHSENLETFAALKKALDHDLSEQRLKAGLLKILGEQGYLHARTFFEEYDRHIGGRTILDSDSGGAGVLHITPELQDDLNKGESSGLVIASACVERLVGLNPKWGAAQSVLKCYRMIAATGGQALAATDCLNYGNPENPEVMFSFSQGIDGIAEACTRMAVPIVSGNVSLYNETAGRQILPTPMIGMIGKISLEQPPLPALLQRMEATETEVYLLRPGEGLTKSGRPRVFDPAWARLLGQSLGPDLENFKMEDKEYEEEALLCQWIKNHRAQMKACRDVGALGILASFIQFIACHTRQTGKSSLIFKDLSTLLKISFPAYLVQFKSGVDFMKLNTGGSVRLDLVGRVSESPQPFLLDVGHRLTLSREDFLVKETLV